MIKIDLTPKMWVYNKKECPKGKIVSVAEGEKILLKGDWYRTPADFPKTGVTHKGETVTPSPKSNESHEDSKTVSRETSNTEKKQ